MKILAIQKRPVLTILFFSFLILTSCNETEQKESKKEVKKHIVQINNPTFSHRLNEAILIADSGDYSKALKILDSLKAEEPESDSVYVELSAIYLNQKNYKLSKEAVDHALDINQNNKKAQFIDGMITFNIAGYYDALLVFNKLSKHTYSEFYAPATYQKAIIYSEFGENDKALECLNNIIKQDDNNAKYYCLKAKVAYRENIYNAVQDSIKKCDAEKNTKLSDEIYVRNRASLRGEDWFIPNYWNARKYYEKAIEVDSSYSDSYYGMSSICFYKKYYKKALVYINMALDLETQEENYLLKRSYIYQELNKAEEAMKDANRLVELYPNSPNGYFARESINRYMLDDIVAADKDKKMSDKLLKNLGFN